MILADKITEERKKNGWSQEELANQLGVSRQAVSKWESAGAVPDLQRILQMSELFGVSTDYLLKDEMKAENITYHESTESYAEPLKKVTMENANEFLDMKRKGSKVVANATSMCILSPILLIVLVTIAEDSVFHVSESLATVFGCVFLLGMVAAAVFLFITYGMSESHMELSFFRILYASRNSSLPTCPLREEKSFSQRVFSIYTDIRKLQDKAKTSYTLSTRRLRFGYEQQFSRSTPGACFGVVGEELTAYT